ncbi:aldo/keto reductase [Cubamyces sp. BRFM 1775]|nr:aldo/keto reductase [Cubamyces sp. BRFM 1775]
MVTTTTLGGTASNVVAAKVIHGLMSMTWVPNPVPDEQAFAAIKAGVDSLPPGVKMVLNSAQFYGQGWSTANLELLSRFYEKYPDYADRTFLMVKGAYNPDKPGIDCSPENLRRSVDTCITALRGTKKIDVFQPARVDKSFTIEDIVKTLVELKNEGKFNHIGLSECSAATMRRAHAVHPIAIVEIEISPTSYEEETKKVIAAAAELDIAVAGYSPLGRGLLTGTIKKREDLDPQDHRAHMARFKDENLQHNLVIAEAITSLAAKKGCTPAQLCIAWVASLGTKVLPLPGSARKERTLENLAGGDVILTEEEKQEVAHILETHPVKGGRYADDPSTDALLWG